MAPIPVPLSPQRLAASGLRLRPMESAFREGSATIVVPTANSAFFNPVQEFNRDLSILAIKTWSEGVNEGLKRKWDAKQQRRVGAGAKRAVGQGEQPMPPDEQPTTKRLKNENGDAVASTSTSTAASEDSSNPATPQPYRPYKFTLLEALAATGLRSIRYAREIPLLRHVIANDLSKGAIKAMKRNVALNFPADRPIQEWVPDKDGESVGARADANLTEDEIAELENGGRAREQAQASTSQSEVDAEAAAPAATDPAAPPIPDAEEAAAEAAIHPECKVRPHEGDALDVMYSHRKPGKRFDVVDLDPYGTAAPFIDGAVQSVADGGLLCVTCTDSQVLASNSYPEKAFALYGGSSTRAEYSHEMGLRLVLHMISTTAAKYGRYIEPQLSLSIDFYVRLFVKVHTGPAEVKKLASKTGLIYTCSHCANFHAQPLGRATCSETKSSAKPKASTNPSTYWKFQNGSGPPEGMTSGSTCEECGSKYSLAGPMWIDSIHDATFCKRLLSILEREPSKSKTAPRIRGMVGMAAEEIPDALFYFLPAKVSGCFHATAPSFLQCTSALLHRGYRVSRSHANPGSIKTDAPRGRVFDLLRSWIQADHPVKMDNIKEGSPARVLLAKEPVEQFEITTDKSQFHPEAIALFRNGSSAGDSGKAVKYQAHPAPNWGPGKAAPML